MEKMEPKTWNRIEHAVKICRKQLVEPIGIVVTPETFQTLKNEIKTNWGVSLKPRKFNENMFLGYSIFVDEGIGDDFRLLDWDTTTILHRGIKLQTRKIK